MRRGGIGERNGQTVFATLRKDRMHGCTRGEAGGGDTLGPTVAQRRVESHRGTPYVVNIEDRCIPLYADGLRHGGLVETDVDIQLGQRVGQHTFDQRDVGVFVMVDDVKIHDYIFLS